MINLKEIFKQVSGEQKKEKKSTISTEDTKYSQEEAIATMITNSRATLMSILEKDPEAMCAFWVIRLKDNDNFIIAEMPGFVRNSLLSIDPEEYHSAVQAKNKIRNAFLTSKGLTEDEVQFSACVTTFSARGKYVQSTSEEKHSPLHSELVSSIEEDLIDSDTLLMSIYIRDEKKYQEVHFDILRGEEASLISDLPAKITTWYDENAPICKIHPPLVRKLNLFCY